MSTEDYLDQTAWSVGLAVGGYNVTLSNGWVLERNVGGAFRAVAAVLQSAASVDFQVLENQSTGVVYIFQAGDDAVPIGNGSLTVTIQVNDETCGNGIIDTGEVCDGPDVPTCQAAGYSGGTALCNATCTAVDYSGCQGGVEGWTCLPLYFGTADGCDCGCGIPDPDCGGTSVEYCEYCGNVGSCSPANSLCPGNINPVDNANCIEQLCGNGVIEGVEQCDGADLNGQTCKDLSSQYIGGLPVCDPVSCTFDVSGCELHPVVCGDGFLSSSEMCDGTHLQGYTCEVAGFTGGTLLCS